MSTDQGEAELRAKIVNSLSVVQMFEPDQQGENSIEIHTDRIMAIIAQERDRLIEKVRAEVIDAPSNDGIWSTAEYWQARKDLKAEQRVKLQQIAEEEAQSK